MSAPTFSIVARVVDENGTPASGTYTWWVNTHLTDGNAAATGSPPKGRVSTEVTSTGTGTTPSIALDAAAVSTLYASFTSYYASQFTPIGIYTDAVFCSLHVRKAGVILPAISRMEGTITTGGTGYPFIADLMGGKSITLMVFWANPTTLRPVPEGTSGAVARAETGAQHTQLMKQKILDTLAGQPPVPVCQQFLICNTFEPGIDYDADRFTYQYGYEAMRALGFNAPVWSVLPYLDQRARIRQVQLAAGMNDWAVFNQARPPGWSMRWMLPPTGQGDTGHWATAAGHAGWAQALLTSHTNAQYPLAGLKAIVGFDEPGYQQPWFTLAATNGSVSIDPDIANYTENYDLTILRPLFAAFLQTYRDASGNPYAPSDFGFSAWSDATPVLPSARTGTLAQRRLHSATCAFVPYHWAETWGQYAKPALRAAGFSDVQCGWDMASFVSRHWAPGANTPNENWKKSYPDEDKGSFCADFFEMARAGADFNAVDGWFGDYYGWTWSYRGSQIRSGGARPGALLIHHGESGTGLITRRAGGMVQQILALVAHGAKQLQTYQSSPEYVRPFETHAEYLHKNTFVITDMANAHRMLAQTEAMSFPGEPLGGRRVAIYFSQSSEHFDHIQNLPSDVVDRTQSNPFGQTVDWKLDEIGIYRMLMDSNVPMDFVDEKQVMSGGLSGYDVLYVSGPNVPGRARTLIDAWAQQAGHVLVTTQGAGTRDWDNEPHASPLVSLGGITESARTRVNVANALSATAFVDVYETADSSRVTHCAGYTTRAADMRSTLTGVAGGNVVARFSDTNNPAAVDVPYGSGRHVHFAYSVGWAYITLMNGAGSGAAVPSFFVVYLPKVPVTRGLVVDRALSHVTNYKRPVEMGLPMVETEVLSSASGWAIVLINWEGTAQSATIRVRPPFTPTALRKPDGSTLALASTSDGYTFTDTIPYDGTIYRLEGAVSGTVPGAPSIGAATAGDGAINVSWSAPASNGGNAITGYEVKVYRASDNSLLATTQVSAVLSATISGLTNGVAVYAKVAAINAIGTGAQSGASNTVTPFTLSVESWGAVPI